MRPLVPVYERLPSPLHAARAGVGAAFSLSFALVALLYESPLVITAALCAVLVAGAGAGVMRQLARAALIALPLVLLIALVNPLVDQNGATLLIRGGVVLGHRFDVTLEAVVYGAVGGLRLFTIVLAFALMSACVDPDELMRSWARVSRRSALSAALATRLIPVLARDASRMSEAARCRPVVPSRMLALRAALGNALDRAVDVAAALEVRGYGAGARPARRRAPRSRQDVVLSLASLAVVALAVGGRIAGLGGFEAYPTISVEAGAAEGALCLALLAGAALPFAGRAGALGVERA